MSLLLLKFQELLIDESMLNGEAVPVPKFQIEKNDEIFNWNEGKRNIVFEGTKVISTKLD